MIWGLLGKVSPLAWAVVALTLATGVQTARLAFAKADNRALSAEAAQDQQSIKTLKDANEAGANVIGSLVARNAALIGQREQITREREQALTRVADIERDRDARLSQIRATLTELRRSSAPATVSWLDAPVPAEVAQHIRAQREAFRARWGA